MLILTNRTETTLCLGQIPSKLHQKIRIDETTLDAKFGACVIVNHAWATSLETSGLSLKCNTEVPAEIWAKAAHA